MNRAIFFDRDGTLMEDRNYLADPDGVVLYPGVPQALARARALGYLLFLFTNQSGVGRGYFRLSDVDAVNARLLALIGLGEDLFEATCVATEAPWEEQVYRKPSPRFVREMRVRYALDASGSFMVGDSVADVEAGRRAGVVPVYIGAGAPDGYADVTVCPSVAAFVDGLQASTS